jgi:hypothetical protein
VSKATPVGIYLSKVFMIRMYVLLLCNVCIACVVYHAVLLCNNNNRFGANNGLIQHTEFGVSESTSYATLALAAIF